MSQRPEPIQPDLVELLDVERSVPAPEEALVRVRTRILQTIAPPAGPNGTSGGNGSGGITNGAASWGSALFAGVFAVGAAGLVLHQVDHASTSSPRAVAPAPRTPPIAPETPAVAPPPAPAPPAFQAPDVEPGAPGRSLAPARPPSNSHPASTLSEERAVLDKARAALARDDGAEALRWTEEHAKRFSKAQLVEEREAVAIQALVLAHRYDEARTRAATFEAGWKNSLFLPAITATLGSIP